MRTRRALLTHTRAAGGIGPSGGLFSGMKEAGPGDRNTSPGSGQGAKVVRKTMPLVPVRAQW